MCRPGRVFGLALVCLLAAIPLLWGEVSPASLWEKTYRAELVARVTVLDGDNRLAVMAVEEVIKGDYNREQLKIVFRARNLDRDRWEEKIVFEPGSHLILFLTPYLKDGMVQASDQFSLVRGFQGRTEVPPEGTDAFLGAIRRFARIQSLDSQLAIWDAARDLLKEDNPHLVEAGFQQVEKVRLADEELIPDFLRHLESPNVPFRASAARCLGQVFAASRDPEEVLETEDHVRDLLLHRAMNDDDSAVRVESIKALAARWDANLVPSFRQISQEDPSQDVRYEAEKSILQLTEEMILKLKERKPDPSN